MTIDKKTPPLSTFSNFTSTVTKATQDKGFRPHYEADPFPSPPPHPSISLRQKKQYKMPQRLERGLHPPLRNRHEVPRKGWDIKVISVITTFARPGHKDDSGARSDQSLPTTNVRQGQRSDGRVSSLTALRNAVQTRSPDLFSISGEKRGKIIIFRLKQSRSIIFFTGAVGDEGGRREVGRVAGGRGGRGLEQPSGKAPSVHLRVSSPLWTVITGKHYEN